MSGNDIIRVGQTVFVIFKSYDSHKSKVVREGSVSKVGRKYFYVDIGRFSPVKVLKQKINDVKYNASDSFGVIGIYPNKEDYDKECKANELKAYLIKTFSNYSFMHGWTLESIERVHAVIKEEEEKNRQKDA